MIPPEIRKHVGNQILSVIRTAGGVDELTASKIGKSLQASGCLKAISTHQLTVMMVDALLKFRAATRHYGKNRIHLRRDMNRDTPFPLNLDQITNFTKLRMFALAVHADRGRTNSGIWLITQRGLDFLDGKVSIPQKVYSFQGHPVNLGPIPGEKRVHILEYKAKLPDMERYLVKTEPAPPAPVSITSKLFTTESKVERPENRII